MTASFVSLLSSSVQLLAFSAPGSTSYTTLKKKKIYFILIYQELVLVVVEKEFDSFGEKYRIQVVGENLALKKKKNQKSEFSRKFVRN